MPADHAATLPSLTPVLVAGEGDVDELVRTARAGVAILALRLRTAEQEADLAAHEGPVWDLVAARDLLNASVAQRIATRRVEMAEELERARSDAARLVLSTRTEAADLIAKASEETLAVLLAGASDLEEAVTPNLRVVTEPPEPTVAPSHRPHAWAPPSTPFVRAVDVDPAPFVAPPPFVAPVPVVEPDPAPVVEPEPFAASLPVAEPAPVVAPVADQADPVTAPEPPREADALPSGVAEAVRVAVAAAVREVVAGAAPASVAEPLHPTAAVPAAATASHPTVMASASGPTATGIQEARSGITRFLYLDVLLPMVAVLVLLIVLLAWVG